VLRRERQAVITAVITASVVCGAIILTDDGSDGTVSALPASTVPSEPSTGDTSTADSASQAVLALPTDTTVAPDGAGTTVAAPATNQDLDGEDLTGVDVCLMDRLSVRLGDSGHSVTCVQEALITAGYLTGPATGQFDQATFAAAEAMQTDRDLYVDGIVGRESAISLGVWPDEESFITRTPPPPPGAVDLMGYPLSSVASAGDNAPPLPENSGSGRRIVYDRAGQRVWAVDDAGRIIRSWLVSGSKYANELPGTHQVYSRSEVSTAWNGKAWLPKMVRWLDTERGAIGFHAIPLHVADDSPYQTEAELGTRLSGGCQRQANADAAFLWDFAQIGTPVIVL
jgi:peptidoglycan hydrolase-like protein with peptidoglycan-binding domain